jgi:hypothetical protein
MLVLHYCGCRMDGLATPPRFAHRALCCFAARPLALQVHLKRGYLVTVVFVLASWTASVDQRAQPGLKSKALGCSLCSGGQRWDTNGIMVATDSTHTRVTHQNSNCNT